MSTFVAAPQLWLNPQSEKYVEYFLSLKPAQRRQLLPSLVWSSYENIAPTVIEVNSIVKKIRLQLTDPKAEVLNFNYIRIWRYRIDGTIVECKAQNTITASSAAEALPDATAVFEGGPDNSVKFHSKREIKPWWEIEFETPQNIAFIEFINRKDQWSIRSRTLQVSTLDMDGAKTILHWRSHRNGVIHAFINDVAGKIDALDGYIISLHEDKRKEWQAFKSEFTNYLEAALDKIDPEKRVGLARRLCRVYLQIQGDEILDYGKIEDDALTLNFKESSKKYKAVKIVSWGEGGGHFSGATIKNSASGEVMAFAETHHSHISDSKSLILKGAEAGIVRPPIETVFSMNETIAISEFHLWAKNFDTVSRTLIREIYLIDENGIETCVESTFKDFEHHRMIISLMAYLLGKDETMNEMAQVVSGFYTKYRIKTVAGFIKSLGKGNKKAMQLAVDTVKAVGEKARYLPAVIFTRHGLSIPLSERNPETLVKNMKGFADFMEEKLGLQVFPCYGTLLGFHRDNQFMPHDDDLDLAAVVDLPDGQDPVVARNEWIARIKKAGMNCQTAGPKSLNIHVFYPGNTMDMFFLFKRGGVLLGHMENYKIREIALNLVEPTSKLTFMDREFYAPADIEGFLKDRYGPGWVKPDPTFEM